MAKLIYCGPEVKPGEGIPLAEGWPYVPEHNEDDDALAAEKVASGNYRYANPPKAATEPRGKPDGKEGDD